MNKYQQFIEVVQTGIDKKLALYDAIRKVVNKNECLDATDKFNEAVSKEVGFEFKAKDYGIKKIHGIVNKNNKGPAYCRNRGVFASRGKYIVFVDSDDLIQFNHISSLHNYVKSDNFLQHRTSLGLIIP